MLVKKVNIQAVFKNKYTGKFKKINNTKFMSDGYPDLMAYRIYAYSKSWRSDQRTLKLSKDEYEFVEIKEIEYFEEDE